MSGDTPLRICKRVLGIHGTRAKFLHYVCTVCILRTQRLGHSPKNTCHLSSSTAKQQSPHENNKTAFNLPTLNMSFFHKVQLGQTQNPCFLTPLQCFVQWQGKAHMPTEHALLPQSPTCINPGSMILDPTSMLCSAARESPLGHATKRGLDNWPGLRNSTGRLKAQNNTPSKMRAPRALTPMRGRK